MSVKVMSVFGTRPESIKMAPLIKELEKNKNLESVVCVTAQHREMLDQVLEIFDIKPKYDLNIMKKQQSLSTLTSDIISGLEEIYLREKPNVVLVHGDTTTSFCAALGAFYQKIDICHIEAGLRSDNTYFPFPEEINRRLTGVMARYHFAPSEISKLNLLREGVSEENIYVVGNTVIDSIKYTVKDNYIFKNDILRNVDFNKKVIVVTAHRRENWGRPICNICNAIKRLDKEYSEDIQFVFLTHLNPIVRDDVHSILGNINNVKILPPIDIEDSHNLLNKCFFVVTDSGGIQEEAPYLGKFVFVLRKETERKEVLEDGMVKLIGTDEEDIYNDLKRVIDGKNVFKKNRSNVYGDGNSSKKIVEIIGKKYLNN